VLASQENFLKAKNGRYVVGDLEDDNDQLLMLTKEEMERKLRESNSRLRGLEEKVDSNGMSYEDLRRLQRRQAEEIEELRRLMANRAAEPVQVVVPRSVPATEPMRRRAAARPAAAPQPVVEKPVEKPVKVETPKVTPRVEEPPPNEEPPPEPEEDSIAVFFSPRHNPCLDPIGLRNGIEVLVPRYSGGYSY
jgi:hypothetical protein